MGTGDTEKSLRIARETLAQWATLTPSQSPNYRLSDPTAFV